MNIEEALEEFNFFNEGDYITKNMSIAKDVVLTAYEKEKAKNKEHKIRIRNLEEKIIQQKEQIAGLRGKYHNDPWLMNDYIDKEELIKLLGLEDGDDTTTKGILDYIGIIVSECNRLEDIEDRKVQIEYNNVFKKGVKSVEDKIKAKIEEYEDYGTSIYYGLRSNGRAFQQAVRMEVKEVLQSLLEKE